MKVFTINEHGGHLGYVTCTIYINFLSHFQRRLHTNFGLIGQAVSEKMFENNGHIHVFSPMVGADNPLWYFFHKHNYSLNLVLCCKCSPFERIGDPIEPCHKIGQGNLRIIIYINIVELESLMLHTKFQDHRTPGS